MSFGSLVPGQQWPPFTQSSTPKSSCEVVLIANFRDNIADEVLSHASSPALMTATAPTRKDIDIAKDLQEPPSCLLVPYASCRRSRN
jgi:hypothetical protein